MPIQKDSETWRAVKKHCEAEIEKGRNALELIGTPMEDTQFERGRIKALREVLAMADEPPTINAGEGPF